MLLETILVGGAIGGIAWVANKVYFAPKKERERRRASAAEAERLFQEDILPTFCIIDSNIWMNEDYEAFFAALQAVLKQGQKTLFLYGPQFDEMCNIKKRTEYGKDRNRRARYAINRIEALQKDRLLTIKPIDVDAKAGAYADPPNHQAASRQYSARQPCSLLVGRQGTAHSRPSTPCGRRRRGRCRLQDNRG